MKHYVELEELKRQLHVVKQVQQDKINILVKAMEKMAEVTKQTFTLSLVYPLVLPFVPLAF